MTEFRLAPDARTDIHEIWPYIANDSVDAAGRV